MPLTVEEIRRKKEEIRELDTKKQTVQASLKELERPCAVIRKMDELETELKKNAELLKKLPEGSREYQAAAQDRVDQLVLLEKVRQKLPAGMDVKQTLVRFMDLRTKYFQLDDVMVAIRRELIADAKAKRA